MISTGIRDIQVVAVVYISEKKKTPVKLPDKVIYIVGPFRIQNELLGSFLEQRTKAKCLIAETTLDIPMLDDSDIVSPRVILLDSLGKNAESILVELEFLDKKLLSHELVLLFNLISGLRIEEEALIRGIRGFFYIQDPLDLIPKGVRAVYDGDLWLSREIMTKWILEDKRSSRSLSTNAKALTPREIEIMNLISTGAKNAKIADQLHISPHTVKAHLYNIYKKIKVSNRLKAALWATEDF